MPKKTSKPIVMRSACPYDDHACRVYGFCGTKKCSLRAERLRQADV